MAVFTLPPDMIAFYKKNIEYITNHAVDPDKRRYAIKHEAMRHYIDLDQYGKTPFNTLPRNWVDALGKYSQLILINHKGDSIPFTSEDSYRVEKGKVLLFHPNIKKLFKVDTLTVGKLAYLQYVSQPIQNQFYEDEWVLSMDSLQKLFNPYPFFGTKCIAKDRLAEHGILPYFLPQIQNRLTEAFRTKDIAKILKLSAEIGHYIGDAHVPLHTTSNYNGQKTDQVGIHGFWESRLPELFADNDYDFFVGPATYIEKPSEHYWQIVLESNRYVDSVLLIEQRLKKAFPTDNQFCYEERLGTTVRTQCKEFSEAYHKLLQGQVEERMIASVRNVGSAWFTAWVNAGQPDLTQLMNASAQTTPEVEVETEKAFLKGQIIGRPEEH